MADRPSGTVTFLFTDIEGSTRLWEERPAEMRVALERHDEILRSTVLGRDGYVFSTAGDAFSVAFTRASDAVEAAVEAQRRLGAESWPAATPIRVRMGLHTGEAEERDGDYFGTALNRSARIMSAGHGGQVLASSLTASLVGDDDLVDLGEHRLKDLTASERVFQVGAGSFPALRSLEAVRNNLPLQRTPLVGRQDDLVEVCELVGQHRLVTLTGIGGAGKTRLATAAAAELLDQFPDGVFVAELAPVADDELVVNVVAEAAGLIDKGQDGSALEHVASVLADRQVLLVLDNCEHVIDAVAEFVDAFLDAGHRGRVLATSRESLDVEGERTVGVRSLREDEALTLLAERAAAVRPGFAVSADNRESLGTICKQLDGIPLAIELAASQLAHMSPQELVERLGDRFELLGGGRRRKRQRQQTLAAMMDWSWELLDETEQRVLAALSVFSGGCTLQAAEFLCADASATPVAELLGDLAAKSLLVVDDSVLGSRYRLLETVRLYGELKLVEMGRARESRDRHASYWVQLAEREGFVGHVNNCAAIAGLVREIDNTRSAIDWLIARDRGDDAAQIVSMLSMVIKHRYHSADTLIATVLAQPLADQSRAQVLVAAAFSAWVSGNIPRAAELGSEAEQLAVTVNDPAIAAVACIFQSFPLQLADPDMALAITTRGERYADASGAGCLQRDLRSYTSLIWALAKDEPEQAERACRNDLPDVTELGNDQWDVRAVLGSALEVQGKWGEAQELMEGQGQFHQAGGLAAIWIDQLELAALEAELGNDNPHNYRLAHDTAKAMGVIGQRPEFLLQPLGRAIRTQDWPLASSLVNTIRDLSRQGVAFVSSNTIAIYLRHRREVAREAPKERQQPPAHYDDIIASELDRNANDSIAEPVQ